MVEQMVEEMAEQTAEREVRPGGASGR